MSKELGSEEVNHGMPKASSKTYRENSEDKDHEGNHAWLTSKQHQGHQCD